MKDLLPIGTIVSLKGGTKKVMIFGVKQLHSDEEDMEYDYIAVLYPEGNCGIEFQYLFNQDQIDQVYFRGYEDSERNTFIENLSNLYDALDD